MVPAGNVDRGEVALIVQKKLRPKRVFQIYLTGVRNKGANAELLEMVGKSIGAFFCSNDDEVSQLKFEKNLEYLSF